MVIKIIIDMAFAAEGVRGHAGVSTAVYIGVSKPPKRTRNSHDHGLFAQVGTVRTRLPLQHNAILRGAALRSRCLSRMCLNKKAAMVVPVTAIIYVLNVCLRTQVGRALQIAKCDRVECDLVRMGGHTWNASMISFVVSRVRLNVGLSRVGEFPTGWCGGRRPPLISRVVDDAFGTAFQCTSILLVYAAKHTIRAKEESRWVWTILSRVLCGCLQNARRALTRTVNYSNTARHEKYNELRPVLGKP